MDFGDLSDDSAIQEKLTNFRKSIKKIEGIITTLMKEDVYEKLSTKEKVDYDLFVAYTLNTLYWLYLRSRNEDPNKNEIKNQLTRIKEYMVKAKNAHERNTIRPTVNKQVAERFVKHGINYRRGDGDGPPPNKITKFTD